MYTSGTVTFEGYRDTMGELADYDDLTIGNAREHEEFLKSAVKYGGGCLLVVFDGSRHQSDEVLGSSEGQLTLEEV